MNYLKLIQEVSKVRYRNIPTNFAAITGNAKLYFDIQKEIDNAAKDFFFNTFHDFRKAETTLSTEASRCQYPHNYGVIKKIMILNNNDSYQDVYERKDYAELRKLYRNTSEAMPMYFCIYNDTIHLFPTPDKEYELLIFFNSDKWAKYIGTVDQSSASGQKNVYVIKTEGFTVGDTITISPNTAQEETGVIESIASNDYLTLVSNLTNTHAIGSKVEFYKDSFYYEHDEPNFTSKYHDIVETKALMELYKTIDPETFMKYKEQYDKRYNYIMREIRGTEQGIRFSYGC
jgi:hypothetical protein